MLLTISNPFTVRFSFAFLMCLFLAYPSLGIAQESAVQVFSDSKLDLRLERDRAKAVQRLKEIERGVELRTRVKAARLGLQMRIKKPNGVVMEILDFKGDEPVYASTRNADAAISTGANVVQASPYSLDGADLMVGIWDAGSVRATHQEFSNGSRVTVIDGSAADDHATHVGGTLAAQGTRASAKGMAPSALLRSHSWNGYISEMTAAGATTANQLATRIYVSNNSWGYDEGWFDNVWKGNGTDASATEHEFGQYEITARDLDSNLAATPYHLVFWAIGNDGNDNPPAGQNVTIGTTTVAYNPALHPPGDGAYRNGFDTITAHGLAKNIISVASVGDAVTAGVRDPSKAGYDALSSAGPTDDGRIKPDLVANGVGLSSAGSASDTGYTTKSGTSMASPNAAGSALLVVDQYKRLFNSAMRASTLKALLIHTATDLGNPGPDYKHGWGLVDTQKAVDLVRDHHANPAKNRLIENDVTSTITTRTHSFLWDGASPLTATLCWADPAGTATAANDSRTPVLVNNLNLKLIAPNGLEYYPYVMPFVGQWTVASMNENASFGINNTDNVESVWIPTPGQTGTWIAEVSYAGPLTGASQNYGLIVSGVTDNANLVDLRFPAGGETFEQGLSYEIRWASNVAGNVTITLWKGGALHSTLAAGTANDGSFTWAVPTSLPIATDYSIRVESTTTPALMETGGSFSVLADPWASLGVALDNTNIRWRSDGTAPWFSQTAITNDGVDAARSGALPNDSNRHMSRFFTTLEGPGTLTYRHRVSSEAGYDFLYFRLNGSVIGARISGEVAWEMRTVSLPAGMNAVEWSYEKDPVYTSGSDAAFVDQVTYTKSATPKLQVERVANVPLIDGAHMQHFGFVTTGASSSPLTITIRNTGNASLSGLSLAKKGPAAADYTVGTLGATTLAAGATTTFTITFAPSAFGMRAADLEVLSNDTVTGTFDMDLVGSGIATGLTVNSTAGLVSSGDFGGPFTPSSITYTLSNIAATPVNWTASKTMNWVTLSAASGTLNAGANTTVTVSINSNANALTSGTYLDTVTFSDIAKPSANQTRSVNLTVNKSSQTITFAALDPVLNDAAPFSLSATASSALPVSYTSSNPSVAQVSGNTVTIFGVGTTSITASQTGNTSFHPASPVSQTLSVNRANPLAMAGGPYTVVIGQSLSLSGTGSQPSFGASVSAHSWDLNNDNTFGDAIGETPVALEYNTLLATWGMVVGTNTIQLRVTDSSGKTSTASVSVRLVSTLTWDANHTAANQTDGAGAWLNANQWWDGLGNQTWSPGASANFGNSGIGGAVTLASPTTVGSLTFSTFTGTYTLGTSGQAITVHGGFTNNSATGVVSLTASPITLGASQTWANNSSGTTLARSGVDTAGYTLTIAGTGGTSFDATTSVISGAGGLTKNGIGRMVLGASGSIPAHSYTGTTTLNGGTTMVSSNNFGPGNLVLNGGVVESYWATNFIRALGTGIGQVQIIGGESGFSLNGATGVSVILGNNATNEAVWGTATFNPSSLVLQAQSAQANATLNFQNRIDLNGATRTVRSNGTNTGVTATLSGLIRNTSTTAAGLIKTGTGLINLNGANTYNGGTTVQAGTLQLNNASALGSTSGPLTVNAGLLNLNNQTVSIGNLTGTGGTIANNGNAASTLTIGSGSGSGGVYQGVIANNTNAGTGTVALTKTGTGTITLANSNTYTGATLINGGGTLVIIGATQATTAVTFAANSSLGLVIGSPVTAAGAAVSLANGTVTVTGTPSAPSHVLLTALSIAGTPILASPVPGYELLVVGNQLQLNQIVVQDPYALWAVGGVAFNADTNGDGVSNGLAWLLGAANPSGNAINKLPTAIRNGAYLRITFRCLKSTKRGTAQVKVQSSNDLGASDPWTSHEAAVPDADGTVNGVIFDTTDDGDYINVIADIPAPSSKLFGRLSGASAP